MAEPFLGEIRIASFDFAPKGWALCNGQFLPINQNQALFALLGTMYGGNGQTTFALPNLKGRIPVHTGDNGSYNQGQAGGEIAHTLTMQEMPQHLHFANAATADGDVPTGSGNMLGAFNNGYGAAASLVALLPGSISNIGGSQAHENMSPYLTLNFIIALQGIFPSQN